MSTAAMITLVASVAIAFAGVLWIYRLWPVDLRVDRDDLPFLLSRSSNRGLAVAVALMALIGFVPEDAPGWVSDFVLGLPAVVGLGAIAATIASHWLSGKQSRVPEWLIVSGWTLAALLTTLAVGAYTVMRVAEARARAGDPNAISELQVNLLGQVMGAGLWAGLLVAGLGIAHVVARRRRNRRLRRASLRARRAAVRRVPMRGRASSTTVLSWNGDEQ